MTSSPRSSLQVRLSWIAIGGLVVNGAYWAVWIALGSREPDGYIKHRMRGPWEYPGDEVIGSAILIALQLFLAVLVLRRTHSVPGASLILAIGFGVLFIAGVPLAMHAPTYIAGSLIQLMFAAGWLFAAAIITKIIAVVAARR